MAHLHNPRCGPAALVGQALEHLRDERRDGAALRAGEGDVAEERVALERLDDRRDTVVAADAQVVALGDVVLPNVAA